MKKIVSLAFVLSLCIVGLLRLKIAYASPYWSVDVHTAYDMITGGHYPDLVVLDVRDRSEYNSGHIYGAVWIPHTELETRIGELAGHENHEIVVYCLSGYRSGQASLILDRNDFTKVYNMNGGISAWKSFGYPVWIATVHNINTTFNYDTIQAAIDAPQTLDGHTILVDAGMYYEHLVVNKAISLIGEDKYNTIIDGNYTETVIEVTASNVKITGFTIQKSAPFGQLSSGIYVGGAGNNISYNIIANNYIGFSLDSSSGNSVSGNNITSNEYGVNLLSSSNNKFYHNNFMNNTQQVHIQTSGFANFWDDSYPSGGNYWSDYTGLVSPMLADLYGGYYQNETGKDGIGDTPYFIDANNQDNYPFMDSLPNPPWAPTSSFVCVPTAPIVFETVTFNASASYDFDGHVVSYAWNFGDETASTETNPITTHSYTNPGTYTVTLNVTDNNGLTDDITRSINIGKLPTSVSISTSAPSTFAGFGVNVTGTLRDVYGNGLKNETVVLYHTLSGVIEWVPIASASTDDLGEYHAVWIPHATGYFVLKVEWAGNTTHLGASNTTTLSSLAYNNQHVFSVESNSTISELAFDATNWRLSFTATGPNGTRGYAKITVAKSLVADITSIRVSLDGNQTEYSIASTVDSWLLTLNYVHSTHQVVVYLDTTPPAILVLFPENKTYPISDVPLTFTVNEPTSWIDYSLDGQANVTITGNTTLTDLLDGSHYVVVYANDTAGNVGASITIYFTVDTTPPNITEVSQIPLDDNVLPEDEVRINVTVIDELGGVKQVSLNYTSGNGTWVTANMTNLVGAVWNATIPAFPYGTNVAYRIIAEDNMNNLITTEDLGYEYRYTVIAEFPLFKIIPLFMIVTLLAVIVLRLLNTTSSTKVRRKRASV